MNATDKYIIMFKRDVRPHIEVLADRLKKDTNTSFLTNEELSEIIAIELEVLTQEILTKGKQ